jgi:hypothetical protein
MFLESQGTKRLDIYMYIYISLVGGLEYFLFSHNIWDNPSH